MTRIVAALEAAGLVARAADPQTGGPCSSRPPRRGRRSSRGRASPARPALRRRVAALAAADRAALVAALPVLEALARDGEA